MLKNSEIPVLASIFLVAACQTTEEAPPTATAAPAAFALAGTEWVLIEYGAGEGGGPGMNEVAPYAYTLSFGASGDASFKFDCNQGTGKWQAVPEQSGGSLTFGPIAVTTALCGQESVGEQVARDMSQVTAYSIYDGRLTMTLGSETIRYVWDCVD